MQPFSVTNPRNLYFLSLPSLTAIRFQTPSPRRAIPESKMRTYIAPSTPRRRVPNWLRSAKTPAPPQLASFRHPYSSAFQTGAHDLALFHQSLLPFLPITSTTNWLRFVNPQFPKSDTTVGKSHTPTALPSLQSPPPPTERVYTRSLRALSLFCVSRAAGVTNLPWRTKFAPTSIRIPA
jgi:hypothetical protein